MWWLGGIVADAFLVEGGLIEGFAFVIQVGSPECVEFVHVAPHAAARLLAVA